METLFNIIYSFYNFIVSNIVGLLNVIVAFWLVVEAKKMREVATQPELVFYLKLVNEYTVIGRLENVGNGVAYNIEITSENDFKLFHNNSFNSAFEKIKVLAPKQYFDVQINYLDVGNKIISLEKKSIIKVIWTKAKKNKKNFFVFTMELEGNYFQNVPRLESLSTIAKSIERLERHLKR